MQLISFQVSNHKVSCTLRLLLSFLRAVLSRGATEVRQKQPSDEWREGRRSEGRQTGVRVLVR